MHQHDDGGIRAGKMGRATVWICAASFMPPLAGVCRAAADTTEEMTAVPMHQATSISQYGPIIIPQHRTNFPKVFEGGTGFKFGRFLKIRQINGEMGGAGGIQTQKNGQLGVLHQIRARCLHGPAPYCVPHLHQIVTAPYREQARSLAADGKRQRLLIATKTIRPIQGAGRINVGCMCVM